MVSCKPHAVKCSDRLAEEVRVSLVTGVHDVGSGLQAGFAAGTERITLLDLVGEEVVLARNVMDLFFAQSWNSLGTECSVADTCGHATSANWSRERIS